MGQWTQRINRGIEAIPDIHASVNNLQVSVAGLETSVAVLKPSVDILMLTNEDRIFDFIIVTRHLRLVTLMRQKSAIASY